MARPTSYYRRGFFLRKSRASWPVLSLAVCWLGLTAVLPLAFENGAESALTVELSPELQRERLQQFSEALMWPLGLAPLSAAERSATGQSDPQAPANCS